MKASQQLFQKLLEQAHWFMPSLFPKECTTPTSHQQKWLSDCNVKDDEHVKWQETYLLASKYTKSTIVIEFQFKFLHRRIATNQFLHKVDIKNDSKCSFFHLFWSCRKTDSFWNSISAQLTPSNVFTESDKMNIAIALRNHTIFLYFLQCFS